MLPRLAQLDRPKKAEQGATGKWKPRTGIACIGNHGGSARHAFVFAESMGVPGIICPAGPEDVAVSVGTVESRGRDDDLMGRCFALGASAISLFNFVIMWVPYNTTIGRGVISRVLSGCYARLRCGVGAATRVVIGAN